MCSLAHRVFWFFFSFQKGSCHLNLGKVYIFLRSTFSGKVSSVWCQGSSTPQSSFQWSWIAVFGLEMHFPFEQRHCRPPRLLVSEYFLLVGTCWSLLFWRWSRDREQSSLAHRKRLFQMKIQLPNCPTILHSLPYPTLPQKEHICLGVDGSSPMQQTWVTLSALPLFLFSSFFLLKNSN